LGNESKRCSPRPKKMTGFGEGGGERSYRERETYKGMVIWTRTRR